MIATTGQNCKRRKRRVKHATAGVSATFKAGVRSVGSFTQLKWRTPTTIQCTIVVKKEASLRKNLSITVYQKVNQTKIT